MLDTKAVYEKVIASQSEPEEVKLSPSQMKDKMREYYSRIINEELCFRELKNKS
jgi:Txe/YoeB family toxin of Txe-Axe toxin-antitoxin module